MKNILLLISFLGSCFVTQAQNIYIRANPGYGIVKKQTGSMYNGAEDGTKNKYGNGMVYNLAVGYLSQKNIGFELGLGYLDGFLKNNWEDQGASHHTIGKSKHRMDCFYLNPSLVIRGQKKLSMYGKFGMFLGLVNRGTFDYTKDNLYFVAGNPSVEDYKSTCKGSLSIGATGSLGVDFMFTNKFAVFGEVFGRIASWSGGNYTEQVTITDSYTGQVISSSSKNGKTNAAFNLNTIGLSAGLRYYLKKN